MDRRDFLQQIALSAAALLAGCKHGWMETPIEGGGAAIVDAHCHLFNASDLPAARFLRQVVLHDYPEQAYDVMAIRDPDVKDRFYELTLRLLGADKAPSVDQEIRYLTGKSAKIDSASSRNAALQSVIDDTSDFLIEVDLRSRGLVTMGTTLDQSTKPISKDQKFLQFVLGKEQSRTLAVQPLTRRTAQIASRRMFTGQNAIGRYLSWFSLLRMYRHALVDQLVADTKRQGFKPILLTPLLVDFDEWLFEDVVKSPLRRQAAVMDLISRRATKDPDGPVVHGFIGFDPLREVAYRHKKGPVSSLETARRALTKHGFLGVKLYPPMGFRPSGNSGGYPKRTIKMLGFNPSKELDRALKDVYRLCVELDAPIVAHGYASNGAGKMSAMKGDPAYWLPVFAKFPKLRVCLAHFGSFDVPSAGWERKPLPEASWEWRLGEYIKAHPGQNVFADISFYEEVLGPGDKRKALAANFKQWAINFDPELDHILFGTDWLMLGKEEGYEHYIASVNSFLRTDCGFSEDICDKIFRRNAMRFLPLEKWSKGRERMLEYYRKNRLDERRLPEMSPRAVANLFGH